MARKRIRPLGPIPQHVPVYARDRRTILAWVNKQTTSVGAAKAAKVEACAFSKIDGRYAWVAKDLMR